jgi:hypothetical protein
VFDRTQLDEARDALYAAPLEEFVALRAKLAASRKAEGDKAGAKAVLALRKPSTAAWGLNELARRHPELLEALYAARSRAEEAQSAGSAPETRDAIFAYRAALDGATHWVDHHVEQTGAGLSKEHLRTVRETLDRAAQGPGAVRSGLAGATLVRAQGDEDYELPEIAAHALPPTAASVSSRATSPSDVRLAPPRASQATPGMVVSLARRRLREQARQRVEETRAVLREAELRQGQAQAELTRAEQAIGEANRAVERSRANVEAAERAVEGLRASEDDERGP